ncbi:hypothetical protein DRO66_05910 [Candidatus Bathyarchaeota archaeon]|nr:MAG: hypothetical protein DRO66_05910 [Candidatus Bathyarchaeota archaeon]
MPAYFFFLFLYYPLDYDTYYDKLGVETNNNGDEEMTDKHTPLYTMDGDKVLYDGHTMFKKDVVKDLNYRTRRHIKAVADYNQLKEVNTLMLNVLKSVIMVFDAHAIPAPKTREFVELIIEQASAK